MGLLSALAKAIAPAKRKPKAALPSGRPNGRTVIPSERDLVLVQATAQRMADVIHESMRIAATSKSKATRLSRIGVARKTIEKLRKFSWEWPQLQVGNVLTVELDLVRLEGEAMAMPDTPAKRPRKPKAKAVS